MEERVGQSVFQMRVPRRQTDGDGGLISLSQCGRVLRQNRLR
jgi:hypothetical protein